MEQKAFIVLRDHRQIEVSLDRKRQLKDYCNPDDVLEIIYIPKIGGSYEIPKTMVTQ